MGYRDDTTALQSQLEILEREGAGLAKELTQLTAREETLRRTIRRKKLRIKLHRAGKWIVGHPKITAVLLIVVALVSYGFIQSYLNRRAQAQRVARLLRACPYPTTLDVRSSHNARIYISGLKVGQTPQEIDICPGSYRLQVVHDEALPWQQVVQVEAGKPRRFNVNLVPWKPEDRPPHGLLIFSQPAGSLLFVNGQEVGRTPAFLQQTPSGLRTPRLTLALAAPGFEPHIWTVRRPDPGKPIWLHMTRSTRRPQP
jgi:PEGA domain